MEPVKQRRCIRRWGLVASRIVPTDDDRRHVRSSCAATFCRRHPHATR